MTDIKLECKTCKNPYCSRTLEERQNREVQVHTQYGWECCDKEKYLQNDGGYLLVKKEEIENLEMQNKRWSVECKKLIAKEVQFDCMVLDIERILFVVEKKHLITDSEEYKELKRRLKEYHAITHGAEYPDEGITEVSAKFAWNLDYWNLD